MFFNKRGLRHWLTYYLWKKVRNRERSLPGTPVHIFFCVADHYEPFHGGVDFKTAEQRVLSWVEKYPIMADKYKDTDGRCPQHTWFYPPHLDHIFLKDLVKLCKSGYGDIEMHMHHNHMEPFPDTSETLSNKINKCVEDYSKIGIFCLPDNSKKFAFIHGDWSLDNSGGSDICGVNNEIEILKNAGCFADMTFPSVNKCQPNMVNSIYYCTDDPQLPKSYNKGVTVAVGKKQPKNADLMMITGPIGIRKKTGKFGLPLPAIESGSFGKNNKVTNKRVDFWVRQNICVEGKPDWVFIKIHTHGGPGFNHDVNFGIEGHAMYDYLCQKYNDGKKYFLHFVTAREMYNIIKAAEAGESGNPNDFRNYVIPKYMYK